MHIHGTPRGELSSDRFGALHCTYITLLPVLGVQRGLNSNEAVFGLRFKILESLQSQTVSICDWPYDWIVLSVNQF